MNFIVQIIEAIMNLFVDPVPKRPKAEIVADAVASAMEAVGPIPKSRFSHVNDFLEIIGVKILIKCIGTNIFPSMTTAQASIESGWNPHAKTVLGVKADKKYKGERQALPTTEEIDGKRVPQTHDFRKYNSIEECVVDYIKVLYKEPWFQDVVTAKTVEEAIHGLQNDPNPRYKELNYATASDYEELILNVINDFGLKYFDEIKAIAEKRISDNV
jgi:flagellum-specific peptidoglycan hydrolase FlgJ